MTSYKTLLFGTIALICAASPAIAVADVPSALPKTNDVPSALPKTSDVPSALPKSSDVPSALPKTSDVPSALPKTGDVPSALPKFVVVSGVAGLPPLVLNLSLLEGLIHR